MGTKNRLVSEYIRDGFSLGTRRDRGGNPVERRSRTRKG